MEFLQSIFDIIRHLDQHLPTLIENYGNWIYAVLFLIVFAETGFVVTPFLPGDSLLFALGAVAYTTHGAISLPVVIVLLCVAANCGDLLNYTLGYHIGPRVFSKERSRLLSRKHLLEAQRFYEKYGRKTIVLARFVPIIRTFAPFVAGIGKMNFFRFAVYSVSGGMLWVISLTTCGYIFGRDALGEEPLRIGDRGHHRYLGAARRHRVHPGRGARPDRPHWSRPARPASPATNRPRLTETAASPRYRSTARPRPPPSGRSTARRAAPTPC